MFSWSSPQLQRLCTAHQQTFTEGTLLSDCRAGTEPSCLSAACMELKQKETMCTMLPARLALAFPCRAGRGELLALSTGDGWHRALRCPPLCQHVALIRQQQRSLSLQGKEQAQISPLEAAGPCRLLARVTLKTEEMRSRAELPVRDCAVTKEI